MAKKNFLKPREQKSTKQIEPLTRSAQRSTLDPRLPALPRRENDDADRRALGDPPSEIESEEGEIVDPLHRTPHGKQTQRRRLGKATGAPSAFRDEHRDYDEDPRRKKGKVQLVTPPAFLPPFAASARGIEYTTTNTPTPDIDTKMPGEDQGTGRETPPSPTPGANKATAPLDVFEPGNFEGLPTHRDLNPCLHKTKRGNEPETTVISSSAYSQETVFDRPFIPLSTLLTNMEKTLAEEVRNTPDKFLAAVNFGVGPALEKTHNNIREQLTGFLSKAGLELGLEEEEVTTMVDSIIEPTAAEQLNYRPRFDRPWPRILEVPNQRLRKFLVWQGIFDISPTFSVMFLDPADTPEQWFLTDIRHAALQLTGFLSKVGLELGLEEEEVTTMVDSIIEPTTAEQSNYRPRFDRPWPRILEVPNQRLRKFLVWQGIFDISPTFSVMFLDPADTPEQWFLTDIRHAALRDTPASYKATLAAIKTKLWDSTDFRNVVRDATVGQTMSIFARMKEILDSFDLIYTTYQEPGKEQPTPGQNDELQLRLLSVVRNAGILNQSDMQKGNAGVKAGYGQSRASRERYMVGHHAVTTQRAFPLCDWCKSVMHPTPSCTYLASPGWRGPHQEDLPMARGNDDDQQLSHSAERARRGREFAGRGGRVHGRGRGRRWMGSSH
ncbi:hypothetical protein FISHEDRAFT_56182 [Fistulina hepatica ATCC 64428]|uniref:Uncharacterized protein n=1 Tax=Fistulina hepatica ATCC 64428 TaxID=1128425 RepID=A0A0D7AK56_9AGAR|nr:hypothetical protein FISHEDRAFT_56182 [Fistulina hepatica ATCC 64428]